MDLKFEISNFKCWSELHKPWLAAGKLRLKSTFRALWWFLRQVSGDAAYENYLRHAGTQAVGADQCVCPLQEKDQCGEDTRVRPDMTMTREEFYLDSLRRRYSGVSRCC